MHFSHALARHPAPTLAAGLTSQTAAAPDHAHTRAQYQAYLAALQDCGLQVQALPADERFPDGHYIEDTAVIWKGLAFICRPTAERAAEAESVAQCFDGRRVVRLQDPQARIEGGDVLFCAGGRVLIGLSGRTNQAGAEALRGALLDEDAALHVELVPFEGVLHLKTGLTELAPGLLLHNPALKTDHQPDFAQVVALPPEQGYAANVLPVNGRVLIAAGYPAAAELAARYYSEVIALQMDQFALMDGGLTCLSLRY